MQDKVSAQYIFDYMVPKILSEQPDISRKVNAVLAVELTGDSGGYWTLNLTGEPTVEKGRTRDPKCILSADVSDFETLIAEGSLRACLEAFKQKRIQARGHLPTILKLEYLLSSFIKHR